MKTNLCEYCENGIIKCMDLCTFCHDEIFGDLEIDSIWCATPKQAQKEMCFKHYMQYRRLWNARHKV
jgi:hypothetical protein